MFIKLKALFGKRKWLVSGLTSALLLTQISAQALPNGKFSSGKKDPTKPVKKAQMLDEPEKYDSGFALTAIFNRNDNYYAVVNGQVVATNDVIANKRVLKITQTNMILEDTEASQEAMVLELFSSNNVKTQVQK